MHAALAQLAEQMERLLRREVMRLLELEEENAALRVQLAQAPQRTLPSTSSAILPAATSAASLQDATRVEAVDALFYPEGPSQVLTVSSGPDDESDDGSRAGTRQLEAGGKLPGQGAVVVAASGDRRDRLPVDQPKSYGFSIWSVLRQAIGRDLTRITMPATINEPLSSVQRIAEELEYRDLLHNALAAPDPIEQLLWVAVFVLSSYGSSLPRVNKPFNPLLGETFEWEAPEGDVAFVCEQVSHHPPISCWHAEGQVPPTRGTLDAGSTTDGGSYQLSGEIEARSRFWGKSIDIVPTGTSFLRLAPRHGPEQVFSYCKATCTIHNIIWGKPYIDWSGEVIVQNRTTVAQMQWPAGRARRGGGCCVQQGGGAPVHTQRKLHGPAGCCHDLRPGRFKGSAAWQALGGVHCVCAAPLVPLPVQHDIPGPASQSAAAGACLRQAATDRLEVPARPAMLRGRRVGQGHW